MASLEYRILSKVLRARTLSDALKSGLDEDHFKDAEARQIWRFLHKHWYSRETAKTLPSIQAVQNRWASFSLAPLPVEEEADLTALIRELRIKGLGSDARSIAAYFHELVADEDDEEKLEEAIKSMQSYLTTLTMSIRHAERMGVKEIIEEAQEHYESAKAGSIFGLRWPWECLTQDTLGKRPGDFIVFYARMKQMKTWLMLYCAVHDFLENNARVFIWSREMSKPKMCMRLASLLAKVDYQRFKTGALPPQVLKRAKQSFEMLMDEGSRDYQGQDLSPGVRRELILYCGRDAPKNMTEIQGLIQEHQVDIGYLDSFYHIETPNMTGIRQRWHRFAILSEDTKSMAEDEAIPIVAVHQANRIGDKTFGNTMVDVADTDVLAREADLVARILKRAGQPLHEDDYEVAEEHARLAALNQKRVPRIGKPKIKVGGHKVDEERFKKAAEEDTEEAPRVGAELAIVLPGNREGVLDAFTIHAVPGYNFDFISSDYSLAQIEEWIKEDKEAEDKKGVPDKGHKGHSSKPQKPKFGHDTFKTWKNDRAKGPKPPKG